MATFLRAGLADLDCRDNIIDDIDTALALAPTLLAADDLPNPRS